MKRWLVAILFALLLVFIIYPSAFIYPKETLPDNNDTRLIAYIIGQMQENITTGNSLYFGRFFAPDKNTLAYSEPFMITSLLTLPFRLFTDSPILILNLGFILNFALTIVVSFVLFKYIIKDLWLSALATILFNFSGFHFHYYPHLQIFSFWLPCLAVYFFLRFQEENQNLYLNLFLLTATAQLAESIFSFYLIFFAVFFLFWRRRDQLKKILLSSLFALPLWLAILYPHITLRLSYPEATRPIRDAAHFSLGLEEVFTKYHGWTLIVLFLVSMILEKVTNQRSHRDSSFLSILIFSLTMSLGPVLKIFGQTVKIFGLPIPLPYSLFYFLFPGFQGFRTPSRFIVLAVFSAVILIGLWLVPVFQRLQRKTKFLFILLVTAFTLTEADLPLKGYPVNINMHPVYSEVAKLPPEAIILELPVKLWNMPEHEIESVRSLYSLTHKHRRFGGFSGFATNEWIELVEKINVYGLNNENGERLKNLGITHVIENNQLKSLP